MVHNSLRHYFLLSFITPPPSSSDFSHGKIRFWVRKVKFGNQSLKMRHNKIFWLLNFKILQKFYLHFTRTTYFTILKKIFSETTPLPLPLPTNPVLLCHWILLANFSTVSGGVSDGAEISESSGCKKTTWKKFHFQSQRRGEGRE